MTLETDKVKVKAEWDGSEITAGVTKANQQLAELKGGVADAADGASEATGGLQDKLNGLGRVGQTLSSVGKDMTTHVTLPVVAAGAISIKTAGDFEQAMANVQAASGATGEELEKLRQMALDTGGSSVYSAQQAAEGFYYMASAGWSAEQMAQALTPTLNLASATQSDLASTTDVVTATISQFGLGAQDATTVADVFTSAINSSQASLPKLADSLRYVGPVANAMGWSIQDTVGALDMLYNAGFKGEQAGTILRSALSTLSNPTATLTAALGTLGLTYEDVDPKTHTFAQTLDILKSHGMDTTAAMKIFGLEAGPGMLAMVNQGGAALDELTGKLNQEGAAADAAALQNETANGKFKEAEAKLMNMAITVGEKLLPVLTKFVDECLMPLVDWFTKLDPNMQNMILGAIGIAAAIGPILTGLGGLLQLLPLLGAAMTMMAANPWMLAIAAIAAIALIIMTNWEPIKGFFEGIWNAVAGFFESAWNTIKGVVMPIVDAIKTGIEVAMNVIKAIIEFVWNGIKTYFEIVMAIIKFVIIDPIMAVKNAIEPILNGIKWVFEQVWNGIKTVVDVAMGIIKFLIIDPMNKAKGDVTNILNILKGVFDTIFGAIKNTVQSAINFIMQLIQPVIDLVNGLGQSVNNLVSGKGDVIPGLHLFAEGGVVDRPTLAMVGEGGEKEFIIPESKLPATTAKMALAGILDIPAIKMPAATAGSVLNSVVHATFNLYEVGDGWKAAQEIHGILGRLGVRD